MTSHLQQTSGGRHVFSNQQRTRFGSGALPPSSSKAVRRAWRPRRSRLLPALTATSSPDSRFSEDSGFPFIGIWLPFDRLRFRPFPRWHEKAPLDTEQPEELSVKTLGVALKRARTLKYHSPNGEISLDMRHVEPHVEIPCVAKCAHNARIMRIMRMQRFSVVQQNARAKGGTAPQHVSVRAPPIRTLFSLDTTFWSACGPLLARSTRTYS